MESLLSQFDTRNNAQRRSDAQHAEAGNLAQQSNPRCVAQPAFLRTHRADVTSVARASWNDGQNEILSFTDIDRSLSGGISLKGSSWGRPDDTIGVGAAINGLSSAHRDFLGGGGLGLLIGDGRLNYREETILEAYYAYKPNKWSTLTFDYQFIANPAYNSDRGPVSIFSARAHAEF